MSQQSYQWYIRFPLGRWTAANAHQQDAVGVFIRNGGNAQTINVPHTRGGLFSARFDTIKRLENNELFTKYTPLHVDWYALADPASGQIYYVHKTSGQSQWEFPAAAADSSVEMTYCLPGKIALANRTADGLGGGGGGGNLNYRKNKISINLHNRSRSNRYRSHRYRKNKHIINLYKRARKGTRRLS
jgi:hypothetical protein